MTFSVIIHDIGATDLRLDVRGAVQGRTAARLGLIIDWAIVVKRPDALVINLRHASEISCEGVNALIGGYAAAIDCGTSYRVVNAQGVTLPILDATGTRDVLAGSDDLGALMVAVLLPPDR
ncbi:hypothetical protein ACFQ68_00130 [Amycolatopsis japonica]|uniref:hypothetical protein n=1 Tax=Amycolatopsis japonica TaxID=208439 RepID=UPI00367067D1